jgi:hypothetical protein
MADLVIFAVDGDEAVAVHANRWRLFSDRVMGGVSTGSAGPADIAGRRCLRMQGQVRLENNGGFVQVASDLDGDEQRAAASAEGIALEVYGNGEIYNVHLRTRDMDRPWQSWRASFDALPEWREVRLPFSAFEPHRVDGALNRSEIRRIGLVAIGRAFEADLCVSRASLYGGD